MVNCGGRVSDKRGELGDHPRELAPSPTSHPQHILVVRGVGHSHLRGRGRAMEGTVGLQGSF